MTNNWRAELLPQRVRLILLGTTASATTVFFFEAFDEPWKGDPASPQGAEKHWGLFFEDRTPKQVMR